MADIRYLVPYELKIGAVDLGSGKPVTNIYYYKTGLNTGGVIPYGSSIPGPSSTATLLTAFIGMFAGGSGLLTVMNHNYKVLNFVMRAITSKAYKTPFNAISAVIMGSPVTIATAVPHGFTTGQIASISGVGVPSGLNGNWQITVTSPTQFTLLGSSFVGAWSGDGAVQLVSGVPEFGYDDLETATVGGTMVGGVSGDAIPLFASSSVRRINGGVGRHWRSRLSLSPMSEIDQVDGKFTVTQSGLMSAALNTMLTPLANGGTDPSSSFSYAHAVSKALAFRAASPFTQSSTWSSILASMVQQPNMGTILRRKPKLTAPLV